jgi:cation diffusion facilitator family transporter
MKTYVKVALFSSLVNGSFVAVKWILGEVSASMALKADAIHSLADLVSSLSVLVGTLISDRKTKTFPFGLYKVENLVALVSSLFIFFGAYEIVHAAFFTGHKTIISNPGPTAAGVVFIMIAAFLYSRYELKAGLKAGSPSLVADAKHITTDMLSLLVILVAILGACMGFSLDSYAAVLVAALVARIGFTILIDSLKVLLDAALAPSTLNGICEVMESHPLVMEITSLMGRSSGRYKFVEATVKLDAKLLRDAHDAVSHLEEEILDRWPDIDRILIHFEPEQREFIRIGVPIDAPKGARPKLDSMLSEHFGEAPFFAVLRKEMRTGNVAFEAFVENRFSASERQRGVKAAELLAETGVDEARVRTALDGKGAGYALKALGIDVFTTGAATLQELVSEEMEENRRVPTALPQGSGFTKEAPL